MLEFVACKNKVRFSSLLALATSHETRLQDKASMFKGPLHVVQHLVKKEGIIAGLYTGMESTFWRYAYL
jgi:hypothetical protein